MTYLRPPEDLSDQTQRAQMQLLQRWNQRHLEQRGLDSALEARMRTLESAFRMQASLPEVADLTEETLATHKLYGLNHRPSHRFGRQCLTARRLVERGVPFIQIYHGGYENNWDQHGDLAEGHRQMAGEVDQPIAGLLADLDQRGLLDSTLVIWGGEFGRGPTAQDRNGRDHNPYGFCMWMAGGGVRRGYSYGETDEFGYLPVEHPVNMHDLHATILHLLGIDDASLTYRFGGREQTPTNGLGTVVRDILA